MPDSTYWWRARVFDGYEFSAWSDTASFITYQGPRTIRVPAEEPTIKAAIAAATSGDTILVADGVYSGPGNRVISFGNKSLVLLSENGPATTILDCSDTLGTAFDGIRITANQDSATVVRGFTIQNADNAVTLEASPTLQHLVLESSNRGILTYGSLTSTMDSLVVRGNQAGLYSEENATLLLTRSRFVGNATGLFVLDGALLVDSCRIDSNTIGIELVHAALTMDSCRVAHNSIGLRSNIGPVYGIAQIAASRLDSNEIAIYGDCRLRSSVITGGQVALDLTFPDYVRLDTVTITGVTEAVLRNLINRRVSGSISSDLRSEPPGFRIRQSTITANPGLLGRIESAQDGDYNLLQIDSTVLTNNGGGIILNGALSMYGSLYAHNGGPLAFSINEYAHNRRAIEACTFVDNDSGAISVFGDSATLEIHRTIVANNTGEGIRYVTKDSSQPLLVCNNVYDNTGADYAGVIDSTATLGNYASPPRFCDTAQLDYGLYDISICAASNNACSSFIGAYDTACANQVPAVTSPDTVVVLEDSLLVYVIAYTDDDGPDTIMQVSGIPSWLTLSADTLSRRPHRRNLRYVLCHRDQRRFCGRYANSYDRGRRRERSAGTGLTFCSDPG